MLKQVRIVPSPDRAAQAMSDKADSDYGWSVLAHVSKGVAAALITSVLVPHLPHYHPSKLPHEVRERTVAEQIATANAAGKLVAQIYTGCTVTGSHVTPIEGTSNLAVDLITALAVNDNARKYLEPGVVWSGPKLHARYIDGRDGIHEPLFEETTITAFDEGVPTEAQTHLTIPADVSLQSIPLKLENNASTLDGAVYSDPRTCAYSDMLSVED